jgi:hypothetical protein
MRCSTRALSLPAAVLIVGCLAAGCGSTAKSAVGNLPSRTATASALPSVTAPARPSVTVTATTNVPVTNTTTVTATPSAQPSTPGVTTPAPTTASAVSVPGTGSGSSLIWLWILLGALVLGGLIAWIVHSGRRRSAAAADWRSRLIDAYAKGSALHDAMSVAESMGGTAPDAAARWADISRRADDLTQTLYALREAVPDDGDRTRIDNTLVSLQAVRSAMEAERAPGAGNPQQADVVRSRLFSFESSLRALREGNEESP